MCNNETQILQGWNESNFNILDNIHGRKKIRNEFNLLTMNQIEAIKTELQRLYDTDYFVMPDFDPSDPITLSPIFEDEGARVRQMTRAILTLYGKPKDVSKPKQIGQTYEIGEDVHIPIINKHGYVKKVLSDSLRIELVGGEMKKVPMYLVEKIPSKSKFSKLC